MSGIKLYDVDGSITEDGFVLIIKKFEVVEYDARRIVYSSGRGITSTIYTAGEKLEYLEKPRIGLLKTDCPSVSIATLDGSKVDELKRTIYNIIKDELESRLERTSRQLFALKRGV